jgi:hypothetical protein
LRTHQLRILPKTNHVGEKAICAGHTLWQLAVKGVGIVDIHTLPVFRIKEAAFLGSLARVVGF